MNNISPLQRKGMNWCKIVNLLRQTLIYSVFILNSITTNMRRLITNLTISGNWKML